MGTNIQRAVRLVISSGYKKGRVTSQVYDNGSFWVNTHAPHYCVPWQETFYDPVFWQLLGKQLGWSMGKIGVCEACGGRDNKTCHCGPEPDIIDEDIYHWHRFIDFIFEGGDVEEFLKELLNN